jgi:hypothetical protein
MFGVDDLQRTFAEWTDRDYFFAVFLSNDRQAWAFRRGCARKHSRYGEYRKR